MLSIQDLVKQYINKEDILNYLHFKGKGMTSDISDKIDVILNEALELSDFKSHHDIFNVELLKENIDIESSLDFEQHILGCHQVIIVGCTLGFRISRKIEQLFMLEPSSAIILDACGSVLIEAYCDLLQENLTERMNDNQLYLTQRYSPGYGDLMLEVQSKFASLIKLTQNTGIYLTENHQMVPEKSVIFALGVSKTKVEEVNLTCTSKCEKCQLKHCNYRRHSHEQSIV